MTDRTTILFRLLTAIWAVIGLGSVAVLATSTKGHPPAIVFAPFALVVWIVGHVLLWFSRKLADRGNRRASTKTGEDRGWPITLLLLALALGALNIFGLIAILAKIAWSDNWPDKLPAMLLLWLPIATCFVGISLRQSWSRYMTGAISVIVAMFFLYRMIESLFQGRKHSVADWSIIIAIVLVCLAISQYLFWSPRVKAFFSNVNKIAQSH